MAPKHVRRAVGEATRVLTVRHAVARKTLYAEAPAQTDDRIALGSAVVAETDTLTPTDGGRVCSILCLSAQLSATAKPA
jgi:hypothetical protein